MSQKQYYPRIDFAKFILSIFVIAIHTLRINTAIMSHYRLSYILDFAVPFFFIAQGFFILSNHTLLTRASFADRILHTAKHILKLYIIWTIIYLPITIFCFFDSNTSFLKALLLFIRGVFFIGENPYSWPLWFLLSSFYALSIIYLLLKYTNVKSSFFYLISLLSFIMCVLINYLSKIKNPVLVVKLILLIFPNGRIFKGLFYITIGLFISKNINKIQELLCKLPSMILIIVLLVNILTVWSWHFAETEFFIIWGCTALFLCCLKSCNTPSPISLNLRNSSTFNYFTHMIWFVLYTKIFLNDIGYRCTSIFIITSLTCLFFSFILSLKPKNILVKYLF